MWFHAIQRQIVNKWTLTKYVSGQTDGCIDQCADRQRHWQMIRINFVLQLFAVVVVVGWTASAGIRRTLVRWYAECANACAARVCMSYCWSHLYILCMCVCMAAHCIDCVAYVCAHNMIARVCAHQFKQQHPTASRHTLQWVSRRLLQHFTRTRNALLLAMNAADDYCISTVWQ